MMSTVTQAPAKKVNVRGISINYDTFGDPSGVPFLLIHGLGMQMIAWDIPFMQYLTDAGYYVIRFDNRDVGLSERLENAGKINFVKWTMAMAIGRTPTPPYTLQDMADDAIGVLDDLGVESAHVLGVSMGGMIAQTIAIHYPARVRTLTSIMSTTGRNGLPGPTTKASALLTSRPAKTLNEYIANSLKATKLLHGSRYPVDEERVRTKSTANWERGVYPAGTGRQMAAVIGSPQRVAALAQLTVPTLVIHGDEDPLVPFACGQDTVNTIPNAKMMIMKGVGHSIPIELWDEVMAEIVAHAK